MKKTTLLLVLTFLTITFFGQSTHETFIKGVELDEMEEYEKAILEFTKVIQEDSKNVLAYFRRSSSKHSIGNIKGAITDLDVAIKIDPHYLDAYHNRAYYKYVSEDYKGALRDFNVVEKENPAECQYTLAAWIKIGLEDYEGAIECYEKEIKRYEDPEAYEGIGDVKTYQESNEEALKYYKIALELYKKDTEIDYSENIEAVLDKIKGIDD